jgi:hypothetical protein
MKEPAQHIKNSGRVTSVKGEAGTCGLKFSHGSLTAAFLM